MHYVTIKITFKITKNSSNFFDIYNKLNDNKILLNINIDKYAR